MPGIDLKGDGVALYFAVVKEDVSPKLVEVFQKVEGSSSVISNSTSLPNRKTIVRSVKQEVLDQISAMGAVLDTNVEIPE